jgi:hypothetical protein
MITINTSASVLQHRSSSFGPPASALQLRSRTASRPQTAHHGDARHSRPPTAHHGDLQTEHHRDHTPFETARYRDLCWGTWRANVLASRGGSQPWRSRRPAPASPLYQYWCSCPVRWPLDVGIDAFVLCLRHDVFVRDSQSCLRLESAIRYRRRHQSGPPLHSAATVAHLELPQTMLKGQHSVLLLSHS